MLNSLIVYITQRPQLLLHTRHFHYTNMYTIKYSMDLLHDLRAGARLVLVQLDRLLQLRLVALHALEALRVSLGVLRFIFELTWMLKSAPCWRGRDRSQAR